MKLNSFLQGMLVSVVVGILCLGMSSIVEATQEKNSGRQDRREKVRDGREQFDDVSGRMINWRELDLSREQKGQLQDLRREFQIATAGIRKELTFAENDLQTELRRQHIDREKIEGLVQDVSSLKQRVSEAATENLLALRGVLTSEQQRKLAASHISLPKELEALQLTEEQQTQIRRLLKTSIRQRRNLAGDVRDLRGDLRDALLSSDEPDAAQLKELQAQIAAKELEQERARVNNLIDIRDVLTPEQLKQLK